MRTRKNIKDRRYSQNTLINKTVVRRLVEQSGIKAGDTVYDIGTGTGAISRALLEKGARAIGIEKDRKLYEKCRQRLINEDRFELYLDDFLLMDFSPPGKYKVFSNIPFIHTADIINKLLHRRNPPEDCYLVLQKEAAERYTGIPGETLQSLLLKPVFWTDIVYHFNRTDFFPVPSVDIVLAQFQKRQCRLVPEEYYPLYREFITYCREDWNTTVKRALLRVFTWTQFRQLSRVLNIDFRVSPVELTFTQYLALFQFYLSCRR
jgi:23S rRNA (adenine-N6)-dimethyltransferase